MSETRPPYGTEQEPAPLTDADLVDIKTRLYGGDAEGIPAHLAELLFVDIPRLLEEVERVRGKIPYTFRISDVWDAFEAGARESRENGGSPSDELISRSADAYCKLIQRVPDDSTLPQIYPHG